MDHMIPSPGFSIPSVGTPLHHLEEDQQIFPMAIQQQQQQTSSQLQLPPPPPPPLIQMQGVGGIMQQFSTANANAATTVVVSSNNSQMLASPSQSVSAVVTATTSSNAMAANNNKSSNYVLYPPPLTPQPQVIQQPPTPQPATPAPQTQPATPMTPQSNEPAIVPQLQNIVSTVNLNCKLDLKKIALQARNAEYNPKRFAAVIMRIREPRTTALIFSSGKMVCTGAKSEEDSRLAARKYARIIQKLGFPAKFLDFKIQNMVGSCDVKFPIRLEGLVLTHGQFSSYEPELFPGLIYRMVKPRIVLLIFVSGKVVLTGAKVRQEIYDAFDKIFPILKTFRKH